MGFAQFVAGGNMHEDELGTDLIELLATKCKHNGNVVTRRMFKEVRPEHTPTSTHPHPPKA